MKTDRSSLLLPIPALAAVLLAGCHSGGSTARPEAQLTPEQRAGKALFLANCAICHNADSTATRVGPGLQGLFRRPYLPASNMPANDKNVRTIIVHGRATMPAFGPLLNGTEIDQLLAYLHTL